jgi:diadenosine tetraphosphatase ApaH/serine/threonine PP2A family protein phosphatase
MASKLKAQPLRAIISDVHGNLEALRAVVSDMHQHKAEELYCLGDAVGYGPNPGECLDILMNAQVFLLGNHEEAMLEEPTDFTPEATVAARWTRQEIRREQEGADPAKRISFIHTLPTTHEDADCLYVHGSPRDPTKEYIYPNEAKDSGKMWDIFRQVPRCCFVGHTHFPGVFTEQNQFFSPAAMVTGYRLPKTKTLCNVGSVGQPRDGDWRACYVLFDGKTIRFRRIEYDVKATIKKIKQHPELRPFLRLYPTD